MRTLSVVIALCMVATPTWGREGKSHNERKDRDGKTTQKETLATNQAAEPVTPSEPNLKPLPPPPDRRAYEKWDSQQWQRLNTIQRQVPPKREQLPIFGDVHTENTGGNPTAKIMLENDAGGAFKLVKAIVYLDKIKIFDQVQDDGIVDAGESSTIFKSRLPAGSHTLSGYYVYQGHGYGIFTYMKGFMIGLKSGQQFSIRGGKSTSVTIKLLESSVGDLKNRFRVTYNVK